MLYYKMNTQTIFMCVVALLIGVLVANMLQNVCGCKKVEGFGLMNSQGSQIDTGLGNSSPGQSQITNSVLKNFIDMTNQRFNEYNPPDDDSGFACGGYAGSPLTNRDGTPGTVSVRQAMADLGEICNDAEGDYNTDAFTTDLSGLLTDYESRGEGIVCLPVEFDSSGKIEEACNSLPS